MSRQINESFANTFNRSMYYLAKVESVDENYIVTFSIPNILENVNKFPTAYPKNTDHVREVKIGDSILVEQLDTTVQFFSYVPVNKNNLTGIYFGDVRVDITDGKIINIDTPNVKMTLNSNDGTIYIGNSEKGGYSLNEWIHDLGSALSILTTVGGEHSQDAKGWYTATLLDKFNRIEKVFNTK